MLKLFAGFLLFVVVFTGKTSGLAECTGEQPNACGILPSTYSQLPPSCASSASPCPSTCICTIGNNYNYDLCGICEGTAQVPPPILLFPSITLPYAARLGGSVASWNGTVAVAQHYAQNVPVVNPAPVVTFNLDHVTGDYDEYMLPYTTVYPDDSTTLTAVPLGLGYGLAMSEHFLFVGSHITTPRAVQIWVRNPLNAPPWVLVWSANDPCPGTYHYFGFSGAIDERILGGNIANVDDWGIVAVGDPAAYYSGRVYIYTTYSYGILQELYVGYGNASSAYCFGEAVSSDSGRLAVGAPSFTNEAAVVKCGAVYMYKWNSVTSQYDYWARIDPPVPTTNGGWGESVAVYENFVAIGDNLGEVFVYMEAGSGYVQVVGATSWRTNLDTRLGYTVSMWDQYMAAGDENRVPTYTQFGATSVWDRNPTATDYWRHVYELYDTLDDYTLTHYGASVDLRGGCILASGAPLAGINGGVYIVDICRDECYGCDGVLNSCKMADACGVCPGNLAGTPADNSTCTDCRGVINGHAVYDACGVCNGVNRTCVVFTAPSAVIPCNTSYTVNLTHAFEFLYGPATWSIAGPIYPSLGTASVVGRLLTYTPRPYYYGTDTFSVTARLSSGVTTTKLVNITIGTCNDCNGVYGGPSRPDACGVCPGNLGGVPADNSTCAGCDGVPNSGVTYDYCGVCGGSGNTCVFIVPVNTSNVHCTAQVIFHMSVLPAGTRVLWSIIDGPFYGTATISPSTGVVEWFNSGQVGHEVITVKVVSVSDITVTNTYSIAFDIENCVDCNGVLGGLQLVDLCGVCGGNSRSCMDCAGVPNGVSSRDACGVCNGDGSTCRDCFGIQNGGATFDQCGVCGGDGLSCLGASIGSGGYISFAMVLFFFFFAVILGFVVMWKVCMHVTDAARSNGRALAYHEEQQRKRPISFPRDTKPMNGASTSLRPNLEFRIMPNSRMSDEALAGSSSRDIGSLQNT